ncbi:hypothetical protein F9K33_02845 [bacterium]|nr:MAG: hypothetical protein F9K33_02845 [bacterium]
MRYVLQFLFFILINSLNQETFAQKIFSVPYDFLEKCTKGITIRLDNVKITGNSNVHALEDDCEMHFGATCDDYNGDPRGLVLEPMNLCDMPYFNKEEQSNADWNQFAKQLKNRKVSVEGVPRIWPEHLAGKESPSNPNHALEIHPVTKIITPQETFDFSEFIYIPGEYEGGVKEESARKIIKTLSVMVRKEGNEVEIEFESSRIGNFTTLQLQLEKSLIKKEAGGHSLKGSVNFTGESVDVDCVTVEGSLVDKNLNKLFGKRRQKIKREVLVLFSLNPSSLLEAANRSNGQQVTVINPLQLIIYGVSE